MALRISLRTENGHYLQAADGGGGALTGMGPHPREYETFELLDVDGGGLVVGNRIHLKTHNGHFVQAENEGGGGVNARVTWAGPWETFTVVLANRQAGTIGDGSRIALRAGNGQWVCAEGGGGDAVNANRNAIGPWETLLLEVHPDPAGAARTRVAFQTQRGDYLQAVQGGGQALRAVGPWARPWEIFTLCDINGGAVEEGNKVHLQTDRGAFVQAVNGGGGEVTAAGATPGPWETFRIQRAVGAGPITDGTKVALQATNGQYLCAVDGGGREVRADRGGVGPWETLVLRQMDHQPPPIQTGFRPDRHGFHFPNTFVNEVLPGVTTQGRCGGMAYAALDFYFAGRPIPPTSLTPDNGAPLAQYIFARLLESFAKTSAANFLAWPAHSDENVARWTRVDEFRRIASLLDRGRPAVIGLSGSRGLDTLGVLDHQVVAFGYRWKPQGDIELLAWDNNHPDVTTTLVAVAGQHGVANTHGEAWRGWFLHEYNQMNPPPGL